MAERAKRVKIDRKTLRRPDEFQAVTGEAISWAEAHRTKLLVALGAVALMALVAAGMGRQRAGRREAAATSFQVAHQLFEGGRFAEAAPLFAEVHRTHPDTPFGDLAVLYQAHALARSGDGAGAASAYQDYLALSPPGEYLRQAALVGLGHVREASGQTAEALDAYTQASAIDGPFQTEAMLGKARGLEASGQTEQARSVYSSLLARNPDGELLSLLRAKIPAGDEPAN